MLASQSHAFAGRVREDACGGLQKPRGASYGLDLPADVQQGTAIVYAGWPDASETLRSVRQAEAETLLPSQFERHSLTAATVPGGPRSLTRQGQIMSVFRRFLIVVLVSLRFPSWPWQSDAAVKVSQSFICLQMNSQMQKMERMMQDPNVQAQMQQYMTAMQSPQMQEIAKSLQVKQLQLHLRRRP